MIDPTLPSEHSRQSGSIDLRSIFINEPAPRTIAIDPNSKVRLAFLYAADNSIKNNIVLQRCVPGDGCLDLTEFARELSKQLANRLSSWTRPSRANNS